MAKDPRVEVEIVKCVKCKCLKCNPDKGTIEVEIVCPKCKR